MAFNPVKRFRQDMSGSLGGVAMNFCGYLLTALIISTLGLGQVFTGVLLMNTAIALLLLVVVARM